MTVFEQRKHLGAFIQRSFRNYRVVSSPDHPLLLSPADLLVGGDGWITAIFLPHARERRNPRRLADRLLLNRLALPAHTRCLLILDPSNDDTFGAVPAQDFTATVKLDDEKTLLEIMRLSKEGAPNRAVSGETIRVAHRRFAQAFRISRAMAIVHRRSARLSAPIFLKDTPIFEPFLEEEREHLVELRRAKRRARRGPAELLFEKEPQQTADVLATGHGRRFQ